MNTHKITKQLFKQQAFARCFLLCAILATFECDAHNVDPAPTRQKVPVSYYQALMISIAVCYGIYLLVRARRKKKIDEENI